MEVTKSPLVVAKERLISGAQQRWAQLQHYPKLRFTLLAVLVVLLLLLLHSIFSNHKKAVAPPVPVVVASVLSKDVPVYIPALGAVTPTYTVTVRTQINGQLMQVYYKEGQMVKSGEMLALIDPRPYEAQLTQDEGQLKRDEALLANARIDLKRYQTLWKQDSVSQQTLATQAALVQQYEGAVQLDQGLIQGVRVNLIYTRITAPVDGRIGLRLVDPGNYVQTADTTGIAVITTLTPITVIFTIPEDDVPQVLKQINSGKILTAYAYDRAQIHLLATGKLLTMDNEIDPTTGTVKLRAQFDNKDNHLFANQFVNVNLLVTTLKQATVVPTAAVQHTNDGTFVYLLNGDKVTVQLVEIGIASGDDTVVTKGVKTGQSVVIEGVEKLTDGSAVLVSNPGAVQPLTGQLKQQVKQVKHAPQTKQAKQVKAA